jgi:hypothetical protein
MITAASPGVVTVRRPVRIYLRPGSPSSTNGAALATIQACVESVIAASFSLQPTPRRRDPESYSTASAASILRARSDAPAGLR